MRQGNGKTLPELLLEIPAAGEDSDFERLRDLGRSRRARVRHNPKGSPHCVGKDVRMGEESGGTKEKIQALLAEYSGLRTESINRNNNIFQLFAALIVLFGFAIGRQHLDGQFWLIVVSATLSVFSLGWRIHRDVDTAAERMRQIETRVNDLLGEKVMEWETEWGGSARGYLRRLRPPGYRKTLQ
jgi:hypothetical protein